MPVVYVPRLFGGTLILTITPAPQQQPGLATLSDSSPGSATLQDVAVDQTTASDVSPDSAILSDQA